MALVRLQHPRTGGFADFGQDNTIIAVAIPKITDQFHDLNEVGWIASSYLLTTCCFQLGFGKFYSFYSIKWVYVAALSIFELGSLVCAVAPNSTALIIGRAIAGGKPSHAHCDSQADPRAVGSAGIFSGAVLIIACTVPLKQRPTYMGLIGGMYGIASVAGPLYVRCSAQLFRADRTRMGGAFTQYVTWRLCFYINLPLGLITAAFIIPFFQIKRRTVKTDIPIREQLTKFDIPGTLCFLPAVVCLLLALQWGGSKYPWSNGRIIALLIIFGLLAIAFVVIQVWRQEDATVPPRVFKNRNVWGSAVFSSMLGAAFFVMVYYLPIYFQAIKNGKPDPALHSQALILLVTVSATKSGIMSLPLILGVVVLSMGCGAIVTVIGYYTPFIYVSSVFMSIGAGLLTLLATDTNHDKWIGYQFLFGAGVGCGMQQTLIAVQAALPPADVPIGSAVVLFAQTLGGALFISVAQNVFTNQLIHKLQQVVPNLNPSIVLSVGATQLQHAVPTQYLSGVLDAYDNAITTAFNVAVATSALSIVGAFAMEMINVKGKKVVAAA